MGARLAYGTPPPHAPRSHGGRFCFSRMGPGDADALQPAAFGPDHRPSRARIEARSVEPDKRWRTTAAGVASRLPRPGCCVLRWDRATPAGQPCTCATTCFGSEEWPSSVIGLWAAARGGGGGGPMAPSTTPPWFVGKRKEHGGPPKVGGSARLDCRNSLFVFASGAARGCQTARRQGWTRCRHVAISLRPRAGRLGIQRPARSFR